MVVNGIDRLVKQQERVVMGRSSSMSKQIITNGIEIFSMQQGRVTLIISSMPIKMGVYITAKNGRII